MGGFNFLQFATNFSPLLSHVLIHVLIHILTNVLIPHFSYVLIPHFSYVLIPHYFQVLILIYSYFYYLNPQLLTFILRFSFLLSFKGRSTLK